MEHLFSNCDNPNPSFFYQKEPFSATEHCLHWGLTTGLIRKSVQFLL